MAGLIFVAGSPRALTRRNSDLLALRGHELSLPLVGVFRDDPPDRVVFLADRFALAAVQLHGREDGDYVAALRPRIAEDCEIWKGVPVAAGEAIGPWHGDRPLFDTKVNGEFGGTGQSFDWSRLANHPDLDRAIIAGGLTPDNIAAAASLGAWALDVNSGVEDAPGIKSPEKLAALFAALRPAAREGAGSC